MTRPDEQAKGNEDGGGKVPPGTAPRQPPALGTSETATPVQGVHPQAEVDETDPPLTNRNRAAR